MNHRAKGIAGWVKIEITDANQHQVGLFAWRQAAHFVLQPCTGSAIKSRGFKELRRRKRFQRMFRIAALLLMHAHHALQVKGDAHLHKHVGAVRRFIVYAQARVDAMTLRGLNGEHPAFDAIVRI